MTESQSQHPGDIVDAHRTARLLSASSVHLARTLARLAGGLTPEASLAVAYAAQAPSRGDVAVDLRRVRADVHSDDVDAEQVDALPWPEPDEWIEAVHTCPLVEGPSPALVLRGSLVYLDRYDDYERRVAGDVSQRSVLASGGTTDSLRVAPDLLTGDGSHEQLAAVRQGLARTLSIIVGGPGTGKTTTVAALLAEVVSRAGAHGPRPRVALAAPTGKAAARLGEALRHAATRLPTQAAAVVAEAPCSTLHRLIGWSTRDTPRFHRANPLPYDLVIVDETSMVSLPLMARVLDAVRPDARLVLVGDPGQLASVEAGTVLSDLVTGAQGGPLAGCITELVVSRRFPPDSPLDLLARSIRSGDVDGAVAALRTPPMTSEQQGSITWIEQPGSDPEVRRLLVGEVDPLLHELVERARVGDGARALEVLGRVRLLCAHRRGAFGVDTWNHWIRERMISLGAVDPSWYPGRPVMVTRNDASMGLYNGDVGVVVLSGGRPMVAFDGLGGVDDVRLMSPARLDEVETVHAMTIHKSQGSEFGHVVVVLPPPESRLASRDLLYTAITRATHRLTVVGDRASVEQSVRRRTYRIGGLAERLAGGVDQAPNPPREVP